MPGVRRSPQLPTPDGAKLMKLRVIVTKTHRWLSLAALLFWLVQALTGMVMVFHWEMDDALLPGSHRPTDLRAIDRRLADLAPPGSGWKADSIWTSAGSADRWDVSLTNSGSGLSESVRIDGVGNVLRVRPDGERFGNGGWFETLDLIHQSLLGGDTGGWMVGLSGILLLSNIVMGMIIAWPRGSKWRRSLTPPRSAGPSAARFYGWHRTLGLWAAIPALLLVSSGVARVFSDGFERLISAPSPTIAAIRPAGPGIPFSDAVSRALERYPGSVPAGISFPTSQDAVWRIRLLAPGEPRRAYGTTTVWIDGNDGRVIADVDAIHASFARKVADFIYPFHTGESAGLVGRLAVLAIGAWLLSMIVIGANLWVARRRLRKRKAG